MSTPEEFDGIEVTIDPEHCKAYKLVDLPEGYNMVEGEPERSLGNVSILPSTPIEDIPPTAADFNKAIDSSLLLKWVSPDVGVTPTRIKVISIDSDIPDDFDLIKAFENTGLSEKILLNFLEVLDTIYLRTGKNFKRIEPVIKFQIMVLNNQFPTTFQDLILSTAPEDETLATALVDGGICLHDAVLLSVNGGYPANIYIESGGDLHIVNCYNTEALYLRQLICGGKSVAPPPCIISGGDYTPTNYASIIAVHNFNHHLARLSLEDELKHISKLTIDSFPFMEKFFVRNLENHWLYMEPMVDSDGLPKDKVKNKKSKRKCVGAKPKSDKTELLRRMGFIKSEVLKTDIDPM